MSSPSDFPRVDLTNFLLTAMTSDGIAVGDGIAPDDGGWDAAPNEPGSTYTPYTVVTPQQGNSISGSFGDSGSEWELPYGLFTYGISREQCEFVAGQSRTAIVQLAREVLTLSGESWKLTQSRTSTIGGITRNDATEPSEFAEADIVIIRASKEL